MNNGQGVQLLWKAVPGVLAGLLSAALFAQEGGGKLAGTVTDSTKAVIPDAEISILHRGTGLSRSTKTDADGSYALPALPIGVYDVTASRAGFGTLHSSGVTVAVG